MNSGGPVPILASMAGRPRIGITADLRKEEREKMVLASVYYDAALSAGGLPIVLPPVTGEDGVSGLLDAVDGLLLTGGRDYDPEWYGGSPDGTIRPIHPRRQAFDLLLAREALSRKLPILGICAGAQVISIACGGTLEVDIRRSHGESVVHEERAGRPVFHDVDVSPGSRLEEVVRSRRIVVNSLHHQAIRDPGEGLKVVARSTDGLPEAIEGNGRFLLGVQWHPELLPREAEHRGLFEALVRACQKE